MPKLFVTYSQVDQEIADEFAAMFTQWRKSTSVVYDTSIEGGVDWWKDVLWDIKRCDIFVYLLSNASVEASYCRASYLEALRLQKLILFVQVNDRTEIPKKWVDSYVDMTAGVGDEHAIAATWELINRFTHESKDKEALWERESPIPFVPTLEDEQLAELMHKGESRPLLDVRPPKRTTTRRFSLLRLSVPIIVIVGAIFLVLFLIRNADKLSDIKIELPSGPTVEPAPTAVPLEELETELVSQFTPTSNADWQPYVTEREFNNVPMVLVPAGCFTMGSDDGGEDAQPAHVQCFDRPFWIDKYEVSNDQYAKVGCPSESSEPNQPRNCVSWYEALDHCVARGARLPTEREWEYAARGPDGLTYPWGDLFESSYVNYSDWGRSFISDVDSNAGGVSWVGAYNMTGNVAEWTISMLADYPYDADDGREAVSYDAAGKRVIRGGSYLTPSERLYLWERDEASSGNYTTDFGFRCARSVQYDEVIDVPELLQAWVDVAFTRQESNTNWYPYIVGREFNEVPMVLVPAGCFMMGSDDGDADEQCFDEPFWIDIYEVSNEQYGSYGCGGQAPDSSDPRTCVGWYEARDFCEARGARLPTEAEWEYAARGPSGWIYPWGNDIEIPDRSLNQIKPYYLRSLWVDMDRDESWVGAVDMAGRVWEWTSSLYIEGSENRGERALRVIRGGSDDSPLSFLRSSNRFAFTDPAYLVDGEQTIGFRCVRDFAVPDLGARKPSTSSPSPS